MRCDEFFDAVVRFRNVLRQIAGIVMKVEKGPSMMIFNSSDAHAIDALDTTHLP